MIMKVTSEGVTIPRRLLGKATEIDVRQEADRIVLVPVTPSPEADPLYELGSDPVDFGDVEASVNHDTFLYEDQG